MMIELVSITEDNFEEVIKLKVNTTQESFVSSNVYSLAQCYLYKDNQDVFPYAICNDSLVVGFALLYSDDEEKSVTIWRIMIDSNYQSKGYGKQALMFIIKMIATLKKYKYLYTTFNLENHTANKLYLSMGFENVKLNSYNEMIMRKKIVK